MILTHEDCHSRSLAKSSGREWQSGQWFLAALGQRRVHVTMNHITIADASCRETPETVLLDQDHRRLVYTYTQRQLLVPPVLICPITMR
jgi:hypothetical protein